MIAPRRLWLALAILVAGCAHVAPAANPPPSELYPGLFEQVALSGVVPPKDWVDAEPLAPPAAILADYRADPPDDADDLAAFVSAHFRLPGDADAPSPPPANLALRAHIEALWPRLQRPPANAADDTSSGAAEGSSLLPLPHGSIVPGGRFREVYYWDAYFTLLGVHDDAIVRDMADNFAHLIATYGFVPNANRSYYLSRSQPPFFFMLVGLLSPDDMPAAHAAYLDALRREHAFWMEGADELRPGEARRRVVRLADGAVLNRYWDDRAAPRDESYPQDVATAAQADRPADAVYRDLRAAAESGWDFSSRWLDDGATLATIETTDIIPPDLNSLLYGLERAIAAACARMDDEDCADSYAAMADARRDAMNAHLWDDDLGAFTDYDVAEGARRDAVTAAALYPLFFRLASPEQARRTADAIDADLLAPGGLLTTTRRTGQQWDAPNGWAPLHWLAVEGLSAYGEDDLARTIAERWLATVARTYCETAKLVEKYDVAVARPGGGGEYPLQDGFGWTNGVTIALLDRYPELAAFGDVRPAPAELSGDERTQRCAAAAR